MKRQRLWIALSLALLTVAVFVRVGTFDFVNYDDPDYITRNPHVQAGLSWDGLKWAFGQLHGERTYWHPLTWVSHMLDVELFGLWSGGHHLVNLLFHTLNVLLVFGVLNRLTGAFWRSALVAAFFAVHPLQVDTVAWVAERKNVLSGAFWFGTIWAYLRYVERQTWPRYALVVGLFALGLLCKPVMVTLPCVLLLLDYWPLRRTRWPRPSEETFRALNGGSHAGRASVPWPRLLLEKAPLFVLTAVACWITMRAHEALGISAEVHRLPLGLRIENAFVSYARYLGKTLWPSHLAVLYPHPGVWPRWAVGGSVLLVVGLSSLALRELRRRPYLAVGWFWFVGVLVPAIGLVQAGLQAMADRFAYLPLVGLFLAVIWGGAEVLVRWPRFTTPARLLTGGALVGCVVVTLVQLGHWRNSIALFEHALAVTRNNFVMEYNLAFSLREAGRLQEAETHLRRALQIRPDYFEAALLLGLVLDEQGKTTEAVKQLLAVLRQRLDTPAALRRMAEIHIRQGEWEAAASWLRELLKRHPDDAAGHARLAWVRAAQERFAEAVEHYREALRLAPDSAAVLNNLAWLLATCPEARYRDGAEAVRLAERACALTERKEALLLGTLAAAYAEAGRFSEAVQTAREAIAVAEAAGQRDIVARNQELLKLYQAGQAYHEPGS